MIKALIFDCFGVLYWDDINRMYNLVHSDQFQELNDLIHACDHGYISSEDFMHQTAELAGISIEAVMAVLHNKRRRNEPLIERVRELKKEYKVSLLSNMGSDTLESIFDASERVELFDDVVISSDVGLIKPSRDLFEFTLERIGVTPSEAVLIDDRPVNTDGAERIGMQTIVFTTNQAFEVELAKLKAANA